MVIGKILGLILLMEMIVHGFRFEVVDGFRFDLVNGFRFVVNGFRFGAVDGLSMDYYLRRCPLAELIVKIKVIKALQADPTLAASLVRLHFHDCFIEVLSLFLSKDCLFRLGYFLFKLIKRLICLYFLDRRIFNLFN